LTIWLLLPTVLIYNLNIVFPNSFALELALYQLCLYLAKSISVPPKLF